MRNLLLVLVFVAGCASSDTEEKVEYYYPRPKDLNNKTISSSEITSHGVRLWFTDGSHLHLRSTKYSMHKHYFLPDTK